MHLSHPCRVCLYTGYQPRNRIIPVVMPEMCSDGSADFYPWKNCTMWYQRQDRKHVVCPLTGGDVRRPGDEGRPEAAAPSLATCGQAGDARRRRVRAALHPRHGGHHHLLHAFIQRSRQATGTRSEQVSAYKQLKICS